MNPQDLKDDYFKQQPYDQQIKIANNYFDKEIADDYYAKQPPEEQQKIRNNFLKQERFIDDRTELANYLAVQSQAVTPDDATATAPAPSPFESKKQKTISIGDSITQNYRGNIDLDKRKLAFDESGNYMTENSITVTDDQGVHRIIPTVVEGQQLTKDQAIQYAMQTGQHLGEYYNLGDAERAAEQIHLRQQEQYKGQAKAIKALQPYTGFIQKMSSEFGTEEFQSKPLEYRMQTALEEFGKRIDEKEYSKLDDEDKATVFSQYMQEVVKPKQGDGQYQHNEINGLLNFTDHVLHTITGDTKWRDKANARDYYNSLDKSSQGKYMYLGGKISPYFATGFAAGGIKALTPALLTDSAIQGTLTVLENARKSDGIKNIATDVAIDTAANLAAFKLVRVFAAKDINNGDINKASQSLFGKNINELSDGEAKQLYDFAEASKKVSPDQLAKIDEATKMFDDMIGEPIPEVGGTHKVQPEAKPEAKATESEYTLAEDTKAVYDSGNQMFTTGGSSLGGALGGGAANEAAMIYEEDVQGRKIPEGEKWLRRGAALGAGSYAGAKYGGSGKSANMFVGAKPDEAGAFANIYDDKIRRWIDDGTSKLRDRKARAKAANKALKEQRELIVEQYKNGEILKPTAVKRIEDLQAQFKDNSGNGTFKLGEVLDHKELFKKYPDLKDAEISFTDMPESTRGSFDTKQNVFLINNKLSEKEAHSTLLHEIQHQIQTREGWAMGGSVDSFTEDDLIRELYSKYKHLPYVKNLVEQVRDGQIPPSMYRRKILDIANSTHNGGLRELAYEMYRKLGGEQEARAVQAKLKYPDLEPYQALKKEEGILEEPIVRFNDGSSYSVMDEAASKRTPAARNSIPATRGQSLYTRPETVGAMAGFEQDENGNWTYNVGKGILGAAGAKLAGKALTSEQIKKITVASFKKQGEKLFDNIFNSVISPVKKIVSGGKRLPTTLDTDAAPAELVIKAASGDKEAFDAVAGAVFSRTFERIINKNTGDQLKPMVLDKLMKNPDMVEELASKFGYKIRYFSSNPDNVGRKIGKTVVESRPATRQKLKKQGYEAGNIWVYDPYDTHGAFNDPEYTKAWRGVHELSHAITERIMQAKYGDSRRFRALGNPTKNPYDPTDPRTYKALTTEEAQRAIEWEDVAFRTQVKLLDSMGIKVNQIDAVNDFNIAGSDTVVRTLTGDFTDPAKYGILPRSDDYKIDIKKVLTLLENQENELASYQGRTQTRGIDLDNWKRVSDQELEGVIKESMENPLKGPKKLGEDTPVMSIEAVAGKDVDPALKDTIQSLPKKLQDKYHEEMHKALTDQSGASLIAKKLGIDHGEYNRLVGVWGGETNPVVQLHIKPELDAAGNLTPEFREKISDMAEMYAVAFRQDGVAWHHPLFQNMDESAQNGIDFDLGKAITPEQALDLENKLGNTVAIVSTEKGVRLLNFGTISNKEFHNTAENIVGNLSEKVKVTYFQSDGEVIEGIKNGDSITENSLKRRPDLQEWFNNLILPQTERVNQRFKSIARQNGRGKEGSGLRSGFATRQAITTTLGAGIGAAAGAANSDDKLQGALMGAAAGAAAVLAIPKTLKLGEKAVFGTLDSIDWVARGVQKLFLKGKTVDEALGAMLKSQSNNRAIDLIKKALVQDYRLSDQYLKLADKAQLAVKRGESEAGKMFDLIKDLPEEDLTALHNFIAGETKEIPDHLKNLGAAAKRAIISKSKELVELGLLPEDILKAYSDGYVHRVYQKHIQKSVAEYFFSEQKKLSKQYKRGITETLDADEYKALSARGEVGDNIRDYKYVYEGTNADGSVNLRRDWTDEEREAMGEITNASYTVPTTIAKLQKDIAYGNFLAEVATDPALSSSVKSGKDMLILLGETKIKNIPTKVNGFVRLQGREFGKLNGMWVEEAVANDIKGFKNSLYGYEKEMFEAWRSLLTEWKVAKTVKNPTAHMNNFVSNMIMSYYAGIEPSIVVKNTIDAIDELRKKGKYFDEAEEIGLLGRSRLEDIRQVVDKPELKARSLFEKIARNLYMSEDSTLGAKAFMMYSLEDDISRMALYMHYRKSGKSIQEAVKLTGRVVFDYTKRMPPLIRGARDTGFIPFISWTYKSIPLLFSTMFQRPSRYAALVGMYVAYDQYMNEGDDKPEYMRGKYITLGKEGDTSLQLRTASMTPYFDWITEPAETGKQLMLGGIPQKGVEGLSGRQFWNDQKITYREGMDAVADYGLWTFNNILPTPAYLSKVYNVGEAVANDGKQIQRNKLFEPRSTAEAAAGLFGLNIRRYNQREQDERAREKERKELKNKRKER